MHRDLKPENLLLDSQGNINVCDFGWSALNANEKDRNTFCGTLDYMAPEVINGQSYDFAIDVWALGVLLYEMVHGYSVYGSNVNIKEKLFMTKRGDEIMYRSDLSNELRSLLKSLLRVNPRDRPRVRQIFEDPWMKYHARQNNIDVESMVEQNRAQANSDITLSTAKDRFRTGGSAQESARRSTNQFMNQAGQSQRYTDGHITKIVSTTQRTADTPNNMLDILKIENPKNVLVGKQQTKDQMEAQPGKRVSLDKHYSIFKAEENYKEKEAQEDSGWVAQVMNIFHRFGCFKNS